MFKTKSPVLNILKLYKIMEYIKKTSILAMLVFGLMSCNSGTESLEVEEANLTSTQSKSLESTVNHRHIEDNNNDLVHLGMAGDFTILTKTGVTNVPRSTITGNVGTSPIAQAAITGFGLTLHTSGQFATSPQVNGNIYAANDASPTPSNLTTAVLDMQAAFTDAAGRSSIPANLNLGAGNIGGLTLTPGVYKWTSALLIPDDIYLEGNEDDVWIFQVAGTLTMSSGVQMTLQNIAGKGTSPQAKNIFWQASGAVTLGTTSHFEGILLGATSIAVQTGASVNGRLLAQTAVTLQMNTVTGP
jgi:hypothetical protein